VWIHHGRGKKEFPLQQKKHQDISAIASFNQLDYEAWGCKE
jgi:hypothetical protein